jgi:site-specific DNA recombinase
VTECESRAWLRFVFYGRVSTEDQQDPIASRNWQLSQARSVVSGRGDIVREYFDIGQSRSLPWKRRPEAAALLEAVRDPNRDFDAVVIGEPQRAFHGAQFANTFPWLTHFGVTLWVPEVGGEIDPDSEVQDLMMTIFGGVAKGERNRVRRRVRDSMGQQAQIQGRYLGGRPPYGYTAEPYAPHPSLRKAAEGHMLKRLVIDLAAAPVVRRIFDEYVAGRGLGSIARGLDADGIPCPSAHDPVRNPHRRQDGWQPATVRAILENGRYTGHEEWNKTHKTEVLLDPEDVPAGYVTRQVRNPRDQRILSTDLAHEPIISTETYELAQARMRVHGPAGRHERAPKPGGRTYQLSGRVRCAACHRKMSGSWVNNKAHYRCLSKTLRGPVATTHPKTVQFGEHRLLPGLDAWIATLFAPENLDATAAALAAAAGEPGLADTSRRAAAQSRLDAANKALENYRRLAAEGADPQMVIGWTDKALADQRAAQADLTALPEPDPVTPERVRTLVAALGDIPAALAAADPADKAELYELLAVSVVYDPATRTAQAAAGVVLSPPEASAQERVRGGT